MLTTYYLIHTYHELKFKNRIIIKPLDKNFKKKSITKTQTLYY